VEKDIAKMPWRGEKRERERCSWEILSVKKEANLSGRGTDED